MRRLSLALACTASALPLGLLAGCGAGFAPATSTPLTSSIGEIHGQVHGGQPPIVGSHVYLYAIGTGGTGTAATSLLTAAANTASDGTNYYVTTDANGSFSLTGDYSCNANQSLYLYAVGGNAGTGNNTAIGLLAALGTCSSNGGNLATSVPYVWINEVSTVAAAYALSGFASSPAVIAGGSSSLAVNGIKNAMLNVPNILNVATGTALATTSAANSNGIVPRGKINLLANIIAACVNSTAGSSSACGQLFQNSRSPSGVNPTDTAQAIINLSHTPGGYDSSSIAALMAIPSPQQAFAPADASATDLAVAVNYPTTIMEATEGLAIDASGNVWSGERSGGGSIYKFSPQGAVTTFAATTGNTAYTLGSISISPLGTIWYADPVTQQVHQYSNSGALQTNYSNSTLLTAPAFIGFDNAGNAFVSQTTPDAGTNRLVEFTTTGSTASFATGLGSLTRVALNNANTVFSPTSGGANGALLYLPTPYAAPRTVSTGNPTDDVALDGTGAAWVPDPVSPAVKHVVVSGTSVDAANCAGGGLDTPTGVAVDGANRVWVADNGSAGYVASSGGSGSASGNAIISAFTYSASNNCDPISPSTGIRTNANTANAETAAWIAVDGSGNVWTLNEGLDANGDGSNSVSQFLGLAKPVVTPITPGALGVAPQ